MMRENHNTQSSEYIIIYEDGLYIVSTTPEEILHTLQDKYKINSYLHDNYPHDPGGRDIYQCHIKQYLEKLYQNVNMLFNDNLPTDLYISFQIIKLLIRKGNLSLIYIQNTDRIPSTTPGAEPPRDTRDSGSARSHSTLLETSSSDRP